MDELAAQAVVIIGVLATFFFGPGLAIALLFMRKRRARQARRSPIHFELLRAPGHTLREQMDEASNDLTWDIATLMALPLMILAVFLAQAHLRSLDKMSHLAPLYVFFVLVAVVWTVRRMVRVGHRLDKLRAGYDAEVAVGQELDQLMRQGAVVFHDFPAEGFNIDHIVISRRGLFAVETKGYTKLGDKKGKAAATVVFDGKNLAFPQWTISEPLDQAERQAQWLSRWASSATGDAIVAVPVVALPGWFVERKGRGPVRVYSGRELGRLLDAVGAMPLTEDAMQRTAHQVEQRCRDVAPRYWNEGSDSKKANG